MVINLAGTYTDGSVAIPDPPAAQPQKIAQGEDVSLVVTVTNSEGEAVDITGWSIYFAVKRRTSDTSPLLSVAAALTTPASGIATVTLTDEQTAALDPGLYYFDVWGITGASAKQRLVALSVLTVEPRVYQ